MDGEDVDKNDGEDSDDFMMFVPR